MTHERVAKLPDDDWRKGNPEFQEPKLSHNLALVERLRAIGASHGKSPGEVAIAWTLRNPAVTGAIVVRATQSKWMELSAPPVFALRQTKLRRSKLAAEHCWE
jgi:aryl-alcohol dehydrogenase-like predicted oxidoreductase